jgi:hypothetical protein
MRLVKISHFYLQFYCLEERLADTHSIVVVFQGLLEQNICLTVVSLLFLH